MPDRRAVQGPAPSPGFLRLAYTAIALTFVLVIVGGVVRVSDSGLGCGPGGSGTEGWPLCGGRAIPLIDTNMIIEYAHRALAGAVAILIAVIALLARRRYPRLRRLRQASLAALGLVIFQAALGGLTVEKGLKEELVAAHLGIAMVQLGLLMLVARLARREQEDPGPPRPADRSAGRSSGLGNSVRVLTVAASLAVLATIVAGGYMSASQLHGTGQRTGDVHTACGSDFPSCGGELLPFGRSREVDIHLAHRAFMYVASALVLALFLASLREARDPRRPSADRRGMMRAAGLTVVLLGIQVMLGALNVWLGEHAWLVIAHLAVGALLWCALVFVSLIALGAPKVATASTRRDPKAQAVPA